MLWTLYTSFAYILSALILLLVTGWHNWTTVEYTALAGAPVLIYGVRTGLDAFFNYRVVHSQNHLNDLIKQRETAITKLKEATKYNSTQQLLEKYGGSPSKPAAPQPGKRKVSGTQDRPAPPRVARTGIAPPPTANIPSRQPQPLPPGVQTAPPQQQPSPPPPGLQQVRSEPQAEFAPNAYAAPHHPTTDFASNGPRWFDRILDVVLGDDETQPKNRIVLICQKCRLVNGQAPPGTSSMEDLGPWRCMSCQTLNGQESEAKEMIQKIVGADTTPKSPQRRATTLDGADEEGISTDPAGHVDHNASDESASDHDTLHLERSEEHDTAPPFASTRSKAKQPKN